MERIEIHPSDPSWANDFQALKASLIGAVPKGSVIHHIGSTAVPGLVAKDVIDIQVSVDDLHQIDANCLESAGFRQVAGLSDHCPSGIDIPSIELAKLFFRGTFRPANIHIRQKGRFNQRYAVVCRDFLRSHAVAANAYALIKSRLAERFKDDADAYYNIKDPVFDIIVDGANEWAMRIGWTEPPGD